MKDHPWNQEEEVSDRCAKHKEQTGKSSALVDLTNSRQKRLNRIATPRLDRCCTVMLL